MKRELDAAKTQTIKAVARAREPDLVEAVPKLLPAKLFPSKSFTPSSPIRVTPLLTPDNYLDEVIPLLASARRSIILEQQYIRSEQADVVKLLGAIAAARLRNSQLDVRIILGKLFSEKDVPKERRNIANLRKVFDLRLGDHIRFIDTRRFVHCHNKLIIVDGERVVTSSQNWSNTGVARNREAGLLFRFREIAQYLTKIFEVDWTTASRTIPSPGKKQTISPEQLMRGNFVEVSAADYQEV